MLRFLMFRISVFPFALIFVHFLGFAYAHLIRPLRAFRNPFLASVTKTEPLLPTYLGYLQQVVQELNLGLMPNPWGNGEVPVITVILRASAASLGLLALALFLSVLFGYLLGLRAVKSQPPSIARWLTSLSTVGMAMPPFFIGSLFFAFWFLYVIWGRSGTIPLPISGFGWDAHLVVPTLVLMARPSVQIGQVTAALLADELGKQYVVAARSMGFSWQRIRQHGAIRNILATVVLTIATSVRLLVSELIVVEWLFDWPGLGNLLAQTLIPSGVVSSRAATEGVLFLDPPVVAAVLTVFAAIFLMTDLTASLLAQRFDPRLREV